MAAAVVPILLLVVTFRSLVTPIPQLTEAVQACATLQLHRLGIMEASFIEEIADIQRSVSYLAIRLFHYLKFLPDREVVQQLLESDPSTEGADGSADNENDPASRDNTRLHSSDSDDTSDGDRDSKMNDQAIASRMEAAKQRKEKQISNGQMHRIDVQVQFEIKHVTSSMGGAGTAEQRASVTQDGNVSFDCVDGAVDLNRLTEKCRAKLRTRWYLLYSPRGVALIAATSQQRTRNRRSSGRGGDTTAHER